MSDLATNFAHVSQQIRAAEQAANRAAGSVALLAVSKTKPIADIQAMAHCGQRHFGENYLQEAVEKITTLSGFPTENDPLIWHYIGSIQSNKTRDIAAHFDWVHTVERTKIAQRLSDQLPTGKPPINICLQINISGEASKSGIAPDELDDLVSEVLTLPGVTLRGLMTIPAPDDTPDQARLVQDFRKMQTLYRQLQQRVASVDTLSMGMSSDLALAVAHGSTMVRVGTALFGARQ